MTHHLRKYNLNNSANLPESDKWRQRPLVKQWTLVTCKLVSGSSNLSMMCQQRMKRMAEFWLQPFVQLTSELLINRRIILFSREALFSLFEMKHAIEKVKQKLLETEKTFSMKSFPSKKSNVTQMMSETESSSSSSNAYSSSWMVVTFSFSVQRCKTI